MAEAKSRRIGGERTRNCEVCATPFSYPVGRGYDRRICSDFCRTKRRHANSKTKPMCVTEGCRNRRFYSSGLCNSCYCRLRDTGSTVRRQYKYRSLATSGYIHVRNSTHPLARDGMVYEHRQVLYDAIGVGPHPCHWCGALVDWVKGKCLKGSLVPDHLDGDKINNDTANLVPSCNRCNAGRGLFMSWVRKHKDDPVLWAMYETARRSA